jgi:hypothetical protein
MKVMEGGGVKFTFLTATVLPHCGMAGSGTTCDLLFGSGYKNASKPM